MVRLYFFAFSKMSGSIFSSPVERSGNGRYGWWSPTVPPSLTADGSAGSLVCSSMAVFSQVVVRMDRFVAHGQPVSCAGYGWMVGQAGPQSRLSGHGAVPMPAFGCGAEVPGAHAPQSVGPHESLSE